MGILEIAVLLTAVFWLVSIPFLLIPIGAYLVYRMLEIGGLLGYLLILLIGWISGGRDGLLLTNGFLFVLIIGAYAVRGLFRNIRDLFGLARGGAIGNRKEEETIAAASGSSPTVGQLEEETTTPEAVDQRDLERARPWLEMVPEDSEYKVSTWKPGSDSPIVESFFDRTLMIGQFLERSVGTKFWIEAMSSGDQYGLKVDGGSVLIEADAQEFDLLGELSEPEPEQEESLPSEAYELEFQLDRMNRIEDRAGDAYGGQHVHPDNSLGLAELQKVLHATIWIPESPSPTLETFDTNTAMIRRLMEFPAGTKIWVRWQYSKIGYGLRVGQHGLLSYLNESEFAHYDWHSVQQKHPGTGDGI